MTDRPYLPGRADSPRALPPAPPVVGRGQDVHQLVTRLLAEPAGPIVIAGPRGIGKSTLCLLALHDKDVEGRFGARRYHVRCAGIRSRDGIMSELARALGASWAGDDVSAYVRTRLAGPPSLVVLDDVDAAVAAGPRDCQALVADLHDAPGVTVVTTVRDLGPLSELPDTEVRRLGPLAAPDAHELFLEVAGRQHEDHPYLRELVGAQAGVPLALELVARLVGPTSDLGRLWRRVRELAPLDGAGDPATAAVRTALELSLADPQLTPESLRLLRILAFAPDGLSHDRIASLLPDAQPGTVSLLRRLGLTQDVDQRVHVRQPIREQLLDGPRGGLPPEFDALIESVFTHVAAYCPLVGGVGGADAARSIAGDLRNITTVLERGLETDRALTCVAAAVALGTFLRFSGLGSVRLLEAASAAAASRGAVRLQGQCERALGDIRLYRGSYDLARAHYERGELLLVDGAGRTEHAAEVSAAERIGSAAILEHGVVRAICIKGIGHVALRRREYDAAARQYLEALGLCRRLEDRLGEADSLAGLADVAMALGMHNDATGLYRHAEELYKRISHARGIANCIAAAADVDLAAGRLRRARRGYDEAQPLFAEIGHTHGEGKCFKGRGDIALRQHRTGQAIDQYLEALACYRQVGDVVETLATLQGLAEAYLAAGEVERKRDVVDQIWELQREQRRSRPAAEQARQLIRQARGIKRRTSTSRGRR